MYICEHPRGAVPDLPSKKKNQISPSFPEVFDVSLAGGWTSKTSNQSRFCPEAKSGKPSIRYMIAISDCELIAISDCDT